jgi:peptidyl-prolyl cis-trans isomerase SDCCAG10
MEPSTEGKVVLYTNLGSVELSFWRREAPQACRNFIQLCLEGYYDNTLFHRVIRDFMVQGGDPSDTGEGGESVFGKPFRKEIHSRLRFTRRGLVAMAGTDTCGSQFFITLGECQWLNGQHTIFARVEGNSLFNILRVNDLEIGENDRPLHPPKVIRTEVQWNPFDDIVPRFIVHKTEDKRKTDAEMAGQSKAKAHRYASF